MTNLAAAIADGSDHSVLIIDLDTRFGDVAHVLNVETDHNAAELARTVGTLSGEDLRGALVEHETGAFILGAPKRPGDWKGVDAGDVAQLVQSSAKLFDYVLLDTPSGLDDVVLTALQVATASLVVTSDDLSSITDTSFVLDLLESEPLLANRLVLTLNHPHRASPINEGDLRHVLGKEVGWKIPYDPAVVLAAQSGDPVVVARPHARASKSFRGLAARLIGSSVSRR